MSTQQTPAKITYFDVRGRAEVIRLIHEFTNTPYVERRVSVEEWPAAKPTFPFGQLPVYEEGDLLLNQSHAIYRHLARKLDLYGDDESEHCRCDMVEEFFVDAQNNIGGFFWNPEFHQKREQYEKEQLPELLDKVDRLYAGNGGNGFFVGTRVSYVDFIAWHFLDYVRALSAATLGRYTKLAAFKQSLQSTPAIATYLASERRPRTLTVAMAPFGGTPETS